MRALYRTGLADDLTTPQIKICMTIGMNDKTYH